MAKKKNVKRETPPLHFVGDEYREIQLEMMNSSDRSAIVVGAAALDALLEQQLRLFIVEDNKTQGLFEYPDLLSSFGARIKMSYYLGLISKDEYEDLRTIQVLRNDYAHNWSEGSFSAAPTSKACLGLRYAGKWADELVPAGWSDGARDRFIVTVLGLIKSLLMRASSSVFARRCTVPKENTVLLPSPIPPPATGRTGLITL